MVPMEEEDGACEECTTNCLLMHKKNRDSSPTVTTFVKVMIGDNYKKVLFLPPRFADSVRYMAGQTTKLEDSSGDGWPVKFKKIDGLLGFEEGWKKFALDHRLQEGDILVFHFIMKTQFVVLMYGKSGCPEIRQQLIATKENNKSTADNCSPSNVKTDGHHRVRKSSSQFERSQQLMKIQKKKKKKIADDCSPSNVNINSHHRVHECSSQSEHSQQLTKINMKKKSLVADNCSPLDVNTNGHHYVHESSSQSEHSQPVLKRSKKKEDGDMVPPNRKTTNSIQDTSLSRPTTSGLHKETGQRSEPLIRNANHDTMVFETRPTTSGLDKEMSQRSEQLFSGTPTTEKQYSLVQNNNGNLEDECRTIDPKPNSDKSFGDPKNKVGVGCDIEIAALKKKLNIQLEARKKPKESIVTPSEGGRSSPRLKLNFSSTLAKMLKQEPDSSGTRLHNVSHPFKSTESSFKPIVTQPTSVSREGNLNDTKTRNRESPTEVDGNSYKKVKVEPDEYEEPLAVLTNSSFSAVMSSYRYLELPDCVRMSKVILLRNDSNLWPVLFETNLGLKALTQNWGLFAKERGIKLGDKCEFVPESESKATHDVFSVQITVL